MSSVATYSRMRLPVSGSTVVVSVEAVAVTVVVPSVARNTTAATGLPARALRWKATADSVSELPTTLRSAIVQPATGLGLVSVELLVTPAIVSVE